jgi:hypothetical protein
MKSRFKWFLLLSLILLSGCAHVISKDLRTKSDLSLTLSQVRQNPESFKGKWVVWGGEIIETVNQREGTTQIEVFQRPLGWRGEPKETTASEGRFLILADQYLDPYVFRRGKKITVAGEMIGRRPNLSVKWIIDIPWFRANRSILGQNTITNPIPIPIMTHGGVILMGGEDSDSITTTITVVNLLRS